MDNPQPLRHPLDWPEDQPVTPDHGRSFGQYTVSLNVARKDLVAELDRMKAQHVVISTNLPLRKDGYPRSNARLGGKSPGVAVYWTRDGSDYVVACDQYDTVRSNMRAIGLTIHHLRRLEAAAPAFLADRAYKGFARLPEKSSAEGSRWWRQVLNLQHQDAVTVEDVKKAYRRLVRICHPDHGGSNHQMAALNNARREALEELGDA
jgi:hypothetical protein